MRIALLTHSTNPRGGVVHALELAEALHALGQSVTLTAAAEDGKPFFRDTRCPAELVPVPSLSGDLTARVGRRIRAYIDHFSRRHAPRYDIYHAQDSISGCALAALTERGILDGFVRTVHHLDRFDAPALTAWQARSFQAARQVLCVSRGWREKLAEDYGIAAIEVGNGVDTRRFDPMPQPGDAALRRRFGLDRGGPVFLAVGGVEARKNTLRIFTAFADVLKRLPQAQLLIVGGASLLDHGRYRQRFDAAVADSGLARGLGQPVFVAGPLPDDAMPGLFRLADALVFPSLTEGFGLVVLEALASGTPAIVSRRPPFTEYLRERDCLWVDPEDCASIAAAMLQAVTAFPTDRLATVARRLSAEYSWENSARTHLDIYRSLTTTGALAHA
ncbi:MSMEG_0565 family glycosyltransferase [Methylocaldum sp. MU1018]